MHTGKHKHFPDRTLVAAGGERYSHITQQMAVVSTSQQQAIRLPSLL